MISQGVILMLYGLGGVFMALVLFYACIKLMSAIARKKAKNKPQEDK